MWKLERLKSNREFQLEPIGALAMRVPGIRFTVRRMMVAVAVVGVLCAAWLYRRENGNIDRSLTAIQLRASAEGSAVERRMAVENLAYSEPDDLARVLPALAAGMGDGEWGVRLAAARSLGVIGPSWVRNGAAGEETELAMRALIRAVDDVRADVRVEAIRSLGALYETMAAPTSRGPRVATVTADTKDKRAIAPLLRRMNDTDPAVRTVALQTFAQGAPLSGASPDPVVAVMMNDPVPQVRAAAVGSLARGWPEPNRVYPLLLHRLKEAPSLEERSAIGWALGGLPPPPVELVPDLVDALSLDNFALRKTIPTALAKLGPAARPALPALAKAATRELVAPSFSALEAAQAIVSIDRDSVEAQALLEPVVALLRGSRENFVRQQAAVVLAKYGPSAAAAVQSLRGALRSDVVDVRARAAFLLGAIGPAARPALVDLTALANQDSDSRVRRAAADATRRIDVE